MWNESQYRSILFINNNSIHDKFIILDKNKLYLYDVSFKDMGKKCFYIGEIKNKECMDKIEML